MADFASPVDAVECAIAVQQAIAKENANRAASEQMRFRIGVHLGDIIVEAQISSVTASTSLPGWRRWLSPGGFACPARCAIRLEPGCRWRSFPLGDQRVKNIAEPVRAYTIATKSNGWASPSATGTRWPAARSRVLGRAVAGVLLVALAGSVWWLWSPGSPDRTRSWRRRRQLPA